MRNARVAPFALVLFATLSVAPGRVVVPPSGASHTAPHAAPALVPNANTRAAGTLRGGTLSLDLVALTAAWPAPGEPGRGATVAAFAERGSAPSLPAPLIRVHAGTAVRVSVQNTLPYEITFFLPTSPATDDSVIVAANATAELTVRATTPGNYIYRATSASKVSKRVRVEGAMTGALIVDSVGARPRPGEQVLVITTIPDSVTGAEMETGKTIGQTSGWNLFHINGKSWPDTDPIRGMVGDSLHWRVINASFDPHPMHLHGFYFRVDDFTGLFAVPDGADRPRGRMAVTERMSIFSAMNISWVPERPGNWLFHCHFAVHLAPDVLEMKRGERGGPPHIAGHDENHAKTGMVGLVVGIEIAPRPGATPEPDPAPARRLRLVAVTDTGFPATRPAMRFEIEEGGRRTRSAPGFSPTLYLKRGERVAITVVNRLGEPTGVHWHGMELESFFDGVPGLSGQGLRIAPTIAPNDSFVARFTPPRSGTFMYHSHMDDSRQQPAGLVGAMIVSDGPPADARGNPDDHEIFLKGARNGAIGNNPLEIGGLGPSDTLVIHAGRPARFRFMNLSAVHPNAAITLTARPDSSLPNLIDTMITRWTLISKDGFEVPLGSRAPRLARQVTAMGETYDFEFTPTRRGEQLRIEIRGAAPTGTLQTRIPIRVE